MCPSVWMSRLWIMSKRIKRILKNFLPSSSHTILAFSIPNVMAIFPNEYNVLSTLLPPGVINTVPPDRGKLWHLPLVASGGACWWRETTTKCLWQEVSNVTQKTTEQHLRSDKSVAYVSINKRLNSTFCTIEANYWQTRSIARLLCDSRATCDR